MRKFYMLLSLLAGVFQTAHSQKTVYTVDLSSIKTEVPSTLWGIFFEDINMGADGGLYAELVKNRSFEFTAPLMGWKELKNKSSDGNLLVINRSRLESNPRFVRVTSTADSG